MKTKMKTTLLLCLFPLLLFFVAHADASAQEFKLKCQEKPVEAHVGENVTLNCTSEPQHNLTKERIQWKLKDKNVLYYKGKNFSPNQDEQFSEWRAHPVSGWNVSEGKLSVEISSVNENDAGVYTCLVVYVSNCTVTLTVDKGAREGKQTRDGPDTGTIIGIVVGVVVLVVGAVIGALVTWKFHEKCKSLPSCKGTQRGGEQDERGPPQDNQEDVPLQAENQPPAIQLQPLNPMQNQGGSSSEADPLTERSPNAGD